jgi:hypothetical protein
VWLKEREVQRVVAVDNVPFSEAVKRVPDPPPSGRSFAEIAACRTRPRKVAPLVNDLATQTVDQRSVGVQVGTSSLKVSSVETETEAPSFAESRVQTDWGWHEFYSPSAGKWIKRHTTYSFDKSVLYYELTDFDKEDPFMGPDGLGTTVGGALFGDTKGTYPYETDDETDMDDEEVENKGEEREEAKPAPQPAECKPVKSVSPAPLVSRSDTVIREGDKVLVGRPQPIGHRPRAGFSPIRPP